MIIMPPSITEDFITSLKRLVGATEAFFAEVSPSGNPSVFNTLIHLRDGNDSQHKKNNAVAAFEGLAMTSVNRCMDGVIEIRPSAGQNKTYCIIILMYSRTDGRRPKGVIGMIVKCKTSDEANNKWVALLKYISTLTPPAGA